jgi:hypothetical protein
MSQSAIVLPAALQAVMSILLLFLMAPARQRSMRAFNLSLDDREVRLGLNRWTDEAIQISNNYRNQFELPVLFFAAVALALALGMADGLMLALAWTFALSRLGHMIVHVTVNVIRWRGLFFLIGAAALLVMWLVLAWRAATGA